MRVLLVEVLALAIALPGPLLADKGGNKGGDKGNKHKDKGGKTTETVSVSFSVDQRDHVRRCYVEKYGRGNCPPGLAKKNKWCLPPGQLKKRYVVGQPVPSSVQILEVPHEVVVAIGPPPSGYRYGVIDGDIVKLVVGTLLVVDAIDGLVD
jgi:hypothetical protein